LDFQRIKTKFRNKLQLSNFLKISRVDANVETFNSFKALIEIGNKRPLYIFYIFYCVSEKDL